MYAIIATGGKPVSYTHLVSVLEGVFARGDRKIASVIEEAYRMGCIYDSWSEQFDNDKWMQAFDNTGIEIGFYNLRERAEEEVFPWDFIDIGVTKKFLRREWDRAMKGEVTPVSYTHLDVYKRQL